MGKKLGNYHLSLGRVGQSSHALGHLQVGFEPTSPLKSKQNINSLVNLNESALINSNREDKP
jgi:hypothetical protein